MPKPYAADPRHAYKETPPGVMRVILLAFGVALVLGLTSGVVWVLYNLL